MTAFRPRFIEQVRTLSNIVTLISDYLQLKKHGKNYLALCPFHKEKTPSFNVSEEKQLFYCFGCHQGGDIFKFISLYENVGFTESVRIVAAKFGIAIPKSSAGDEAASKQREALLEIQALAAEYYIRHLASPGGKKARAYLDARGLGGDMAEKTKIGASPDAWDRLLTYIGGKRKFRDGEIEACGLFLKRKKGDGYYDRFRDRLMFPIFSPFGDIIGFSGRSLSDAEPKYLNSPETPLFRKGENLFGLNFAKEKIREKKQVIVVEGNFDALTLHQAGLTHTVAPLGTAFTSEHVRLLGRYAKHVIINFDQDAAGYRATLRALTLFLEEGYGVKIVNLPEGYDPDGFLREKGKEVYEEKISRAQDAIEYVVKKEIASRPSLKGTDKVEIIENMLPVIGKVKNRILLEEYTAALAEHLAVDVRLLLAELDRANKGGEKMKPAGIRGTYTRGVPEGRKTAALRYHA